MIRKGCMDDQALIMGIIQDAVIDMESKCIYQWDSIYPGEDVINNDISNGTLYVCEDCGTIKGIIVLNEYQSKEYEEVEWEFNTGRKLIVHRLCVDPRHQGQGFARLLMDNAELYGKELGYDVIRFDAFVDNKRACCLYEKSGYKVAGTIDFRKGKFYCFEKRLE